MKKVPPVALNNFGGHIWIKWGTSSCNDNMSQYDKKSSFRIRSKGKGKEDVIDFTAIFNYLLISKWMPYERKQFDEDLSCLRKSYLFHLEKS